MTILPCKNCAYLLLRCMSMIVENAGEPAMNGVKETEDGVVIISEDDKTSAKYSQHKKGFHTDNRMQGRQ